MTNLAIGDAAPHFSLPGNGDTTLSLDDYKGQKLVIYFYPKDNTPGCTKESCEFRDALPDFTGINAAILGVSKDSVKSHDKFVEKQNLNFPLVSDEDLTMCADYGVWAEKSMYGKTFMGINRSTFLIDENGKIIKIWRKVKVNGHVADVLKTLQDHDKVAA